MTWVLRTVGGGEASILFWFWVGIVVAVALYALGFLVDATMTERMAVLDLVGRSDRWCLSGRSCCTYRPPLLLAEIGEGLFFILCSFVI